MTRQIEAIGTRVRLSERVAESRSIRLKIVDHREHLAELFPSAGQFASCDQIMPPSQMTALRDCPHSAIPISKSSFLSACRPGVWTKRWPLIERGDKGHK